MGVDKATMPFRGRPMVEIAVETLRAVCAEVFLSGNRDDLAKWAPVVHELRAEAGPAAGIEASLAQSTREWVMMLPADLPLMRVELLRRWGEAVLSREDVQASYLVCGDEWHPAVCMVRRGCLPLFQAELDAGDRKLMRIFGKLDEGLLVLEASELMGDVERCFTNVNTPEELRVAEQMTY
jgi:molybdopterin-guanine dinucleotide biosynthesis protein A